MVRAVSDGVEREGGNVKPHTELERGRGCPVV